MSNLKTRRRPGWALLAAASALVMLLPAGAGAQDVSIEIPLDTVVKAAPGTVTELASEVVPDEFVGEYCLVRAVSHNQTSVHPGNNLVFASGADELVLYDVEGEANGDRVIEGYITLGETIIVSLVMGSDGVFSAGMVAEVYCPAPQTTTTVPETTVPETTAPETTAPETTAPDTTVPPTTVPDTTSTSVLPQSTSTTAPETTTTAAGDTTTSTPPESTLPFTGLDSGGTATIALVALAVGSALTMLTRDPEKT